jgi:5-methylcytosine-specific restriction endonuclease McrA
MKKYSIEEVFNLLGQDALNISEVGFRRHRESIEVDGYKVYTKSLRYATFYQKGCKCARCGKEGTYFQLDSGDQPERRHFNLYAADGTLITKDHIVPKKHGGKDTVDNMQTMCVICNRAKGCDMPQ